MATIHLSTTRSSAVCCQPGNQSPLKVSVQLSGQSIFTRHIALASGDCPNFRPRRYEALPLDGNNGQVISQGQLTQSVPITPENYTLLHRPWIMGITYSLGCVTGAVDLEPPTIGFLSKYTQTRRSPDRSDPKTHYSRPAPSLPPRHCPHRSHGIGSASNGRPSPPVSRSVLVDAPAPC